MGIVNRVRVVSPFCLRRKYDHPYWTIATFALIPGNEDDASILVCLRVENRREVLCKPGIALLHSIVERRTGVVHIIAQIGRDEVVASLRILLQVRDQLAVWPYMCDAGGRIRIVGVCDIVKEDHRIVLRSV